jgi:hypothetical protein
VREQARKVPGERPRIDGPSVGPTKHQPVILIGLAEEELLLGLSRFMAFQLFEDIFGNRDRPPGMLGFGLLEE